MDVNQCQVLPQDEVYKIIRGTWKKSNRASYVNSFPNTLKLLLNLQDQNIFLSNKESRAGRTEPIKIQRRLCDLLPEYIVETVEAIGNLKLPENATFSYNQIIEIMITNLQTFNKNNFYFSKFEKAPISSIKEMVIETGVLRHVSSDVKYNNPNNKKAAKFNANFWGYNLSKAYASLK